MDGSRLERPYRYAFRVRGAARIGRGARGPESAGALLTPGAKLEIVTDAPADPRTVEASMYLEFNTLCKDRGPIRVQAEDQRPIAADDRWDFREAGGWERDRSADPLRRVVRLAPVRRLPRGCTGWLVAPASFDDQGRATLQRWEFATYGDFKLARAACSWDAKFCPTGPVIAHFSTPVKGAEILRHLRLVPSAKFTVGDTADVRSSWVIETTLKPRTRYAVVADSALADVFGQRLTGNPAASVATTGYAPGDRLSLRPHGRRAEWPADVQHRIRQCRHARRARRADSRLLEPQFLAAREWRWAELWPALLPAAKRQRIAVRGKRDQLRAYGLTLPAPAYTGKGTPTLFALQVTSGRLDSMSRSQRPIAVVQVTDIGAHARVGTGRRCRLGHRCE